MPRRSSRTSRSPRARTGARCGSTPCIRAPAYLASPHRDRAQPARLPGMADIHPRLRAVWDLSVAEVREYCGRHEYDGTIQDLSPDGVRAGLGRLGAGETLADDHDEAHLAVFERARAAHLAAWPDAAEAAVGSLNAVTAPVAKALAGAARGLAAGIGADADPQAGAAARAAHARLVG